MKTLREKKKLLVTSIFLVSLYRWVGATLFLVPIQSIGTKHGVALTHRYIIM